MQGIRKKKAESLLKREISEIILRELKDPRVKFVTITGVSLTNDLKAAHVYVSVMGGEKDKKGSMAGLRSAAGFVRGRIGDNVRLRYNPEIKFEIDDTLETRDRIEQLFRKIEESRTDE